MITENEIEVPTIEISHHGWIFTVGVPGWAHLNTSSKPKRRNVYYPGFLLRKSGGQWAPPGEPCRYPEVSRTLEAAYQKLLTQESHHLLIQEIGADPDE